MRIEAVSLCLHVLSGEKREGISAGRARLLFDAFEVVTGFV
jgi:hypothetical protein